LNSNYKKILVIQTAFLGDVVLTLPMVQVLKRENPDCEIDFLCIPAMEVLFKNNPLLNKVIVYDKRGSDSFSKIKSEIKGKYDVVISPHRSTRSALLAYFSKAKKRITFDKSSLSFLYTDKVKYVQGIHEIQRNLSLLNPLGINEDGIIKPELFLSDIEKNSIDKFLNDNGVNNEKLIGLAPGTVWFTKQYPKEKFVKVLNLLKDSDASVILIGGKDDIEHGKYLKDNSSNKNIVDAIGMLNVLESAELIKRCEVLITNDSAPLHLANAVETRVVSIFGATIPQFGFFPYGVNDTILETEGLKCRPCSIHGGNKCPIGTFICMNNIQEEKIVQLAGKSLS